MTLRELFSAYAPDLAVNVTICDKQDSVYCLQFRFENPDSHDFEIFDKYGDTRIFEWFAANDRLVIELDLERL